MKDFLKVFVVTLWVRLLTAIHDKVVLYRIIVKTWLVLAGLWIGLEALRQLIHWLNSL